MINAMSTIVGRLPPKCVDDDPGKVTRTLGVLGILKTATAIKTAANDYYRGLFAYRQNKKKTFKVCTRENKKEQKKKVSRDHQGGSKF